LIAARSVRMLQGDRDALFPISGARRAGHNTESIYRLIGHPERACFDEVPDQPHAYSRPYRERMYGWMARHLLGEGDGQPIAEGDVKPLSEDDRGLLCDPQGSIVPGSPSVVDLARRRAMVALAALTLTPSQEIRRWVSS